MTYLLVIEGGALNSLTTTVLESICSYYIYVYIYMYIYNVKYMSIFHIFDEIMCTDIGCIKVDNCYFLLMYCPFY
jgi:hypothetical protein